MSNERSDMVHEHWRQSSEKFDYFITGVTGALCAYISQTFQPAHISFSPNTLELVALLTLSLSALFGFKRTESVVETHRHSHSSLYISEQIGQLVTKYNGGSLVNESTGEVLSPQEISEKVNRLRSAQPKIRANADRAANKAGDWYIWRNRMLGFGFLMLIAAKVWYAYV